MKRYATHLVLTASFVFVAAPAYIIAQPKDAGAAVSLINLIATPEQYHGKVVFISVYATIAFENMSLCPAKAVLTAKDCLWLEIDSGSSETDQDHKRYLELREVWKRFDGQPISLRGTFNKDNTGHFGGWSGGVENVTEVFGKHLYVNFTSNPPLQRIQRKQRAAER